jgi:glycosyl hydrolase family 31/uncharacterized protein DUF5110
MAALRRVGPLAVLRLVFGALFAALLVAAGTGFAGVSAAGATPGGSAAGSSGAASQDTSPVDLKTPVDISAGTAHPSAIVHVGPVRVEVLGPTLLRLEYSPSQHFEDAPTVNALDRRMPVARYAVSTAGGWLTVRTARATLRYKLGSGPFTTRNTSLTLSVAGRTSTVAPAWEWVCTFGQVCQAGAATLGGGATLSQTFTGYQSTAGYAGFFVKAGSSVTWHVLGSSAGAAVVAVRYGNVPSPPVAPVTSTLDLDVNGRPQHVIEAVPTTTAQPWATVITTVPLVAGTNTITVVDTTPNSFDLGVDTLAVGPAGSPPPVAASTGPLGGWFRGFDTDTYNDTPTCGPGQSGATCDAVIQPLNTDGLLDTAGWRLLDDTQSAVWTTKGWTTTRPPHGDVEDGYLFAYGHDYAGALRTLAQLTGPAPLPPRNVFGVWYSDYTPYSSNDIERTIYPAFASNDVPLNALSLDTDWKAPNDWNGWEWNASLFPSPSAFLSWAHAHGIDVTLNIHSSIDDNDPKLAQTERIAGHTLASSSCTNGSCKVWDWSSIPQAESNFALQQSFQKQGVAFWWLDWCCDNSVVSSPGVTPDAWIDHLYAQDMANLGQRGFVLARIGGSNGDPQEVYPAGPWSDHTSTIAFTGDAWGTWNTLAAEAALVPDEASIGEPYVSSDIGSYLGPPPTQSGADPPDLYDRWVQLGTFQPILRLHSNNENRLPWQYPQPVQGITESFLRLREALLPYTYTLADAATRTGLPMTSPLYLDEPGQPAAYENPTEYLYGPDMLVAPVTTPGDVASSTVWFPPGRWVDFFTGATFTGPSTATLSVPLDRMPVFVRQGGIVPEQPSDGGTGPPRALTALVYPGSSGSFDLYGDAGTGLRYASGQRTETPITTSTSAPAGGTHSVGVTIGAARGSYAGEPAAQETTVELVDVTRPTRVTLDGRALRPQGGSGAHWSYDAPTATLSVDLGSRPVSQAARVVAVGAATTARGEPTDPASGSSQGRKPRVPRWAP